MLVCLRYIPSADARGAAATTVGALNSLLTLRHGGVGTGAQRLDALKRSVAVTTLGGSGQLLQVQVAQLATGSLDHAPAVRPGVVRVALTQSQPLSHLTVLVFSFHQVETLLQDDMAMNTEIDDDIVSSSHANVDSIMPYFACTASTIVHTFGIQQR